MEDTNMEDTNMENNETEQRQNAERIIQSHIIWSLGAGFVPIPILDIAAVSAIQLDMIKQLCREYEVNYSESSGKALLSAVVGSSLASVGSSLIKAIPGIGTVLGSISMPVLSGASTYGIGHALIWHFESGGDLFDIEFSVIKDVYKEFFKKGKEVVQGLQKNKSASSDALIKKLEELLQLKEKGLISEEEYEAKKQELLNQL